MIPRGQTTGFRTTAIPRYGVLLQRAIKVGIWIPALGCMRNMAMGGKIWLLTLAALATSPLQAVADDTPLSAADVSAIIRQVQSVHPPDRFTARPSESHFQGRAVRVAFPVQSSDRGLLATWTYNSNAQELKFQITPNFASAFLSNFSALPLDVYEISGGYGPSSHYVGSNAFGVERHVEKNHRTSIGLAVVLPEPHRPAYTSVVEQTVRISPSEARLLTEHLKFVVEGAISNFEPDRVVNCGSTHSGPTLESPYDYTEHDCFLAVTVSEMAIVDTRDGHKVVTWVSPYSP